MRYGFDYNYRFNQLLTIIFMFISILLVFFLNIAF